MERCWGPAVVRPEASGRVAVGEVLVQVYRYLMEPIRADEGPRLCPAWEMEVLAAELVHAQSRRVGIACPNGLPNEGDLGRRVDALGSARLWNGTFWCVP